MLNNHFKMAWRSLFKNKVTTLINLTGLSVGMTASILIFFWVQNEMSYNQFPGSENIYRISNSVKVSPSETWHWESSPMPLAPAAKERIPEVESFSRLLLKEPSVVNANNERFTEKNLAYVDAPWLDMFGYDFVSGSAADFKKNPFSIILTESSARKYFGDESAAGKVITLDKKNYMVSGVIRDIPLNSSFRFDGFLSLKSYLSAPENQSEKPWGSFGFISFLKLRPDANPDLVAQKVDAVLTGNRQENSIRASLLSIREMYFEEGLQSSELAHGNQKTTYIFIALAILLLVIACINYVNLTTARASLRSKEVSIRKITGAGKGTLFSQFMTESLVSSLLALLFTIALIHLALPFFNNLTEKEFVFDIGSFTVWQVVIGTLLFAAILNGIYPAILLSSFKPLQVVKGISVLKMKDVSVRKGLVVFQFSLAVMLIISTIVIYKQLSFLQNSDPGYDASQVLSLEIPFDPAVDAESVSRVLKQEMLSNSGIEKVTAAGSPIIDLNNFSSGNVDWEGRSEDFNPSLVQYTADADFNSVLDLKMLQGKWFSPGTEDKNNYIINETAVKEFRLKMPVIGQRFTMDGVQGQIVGVVNDFHYKSMRDKIAPMVIKNSTAGNHFVYLKIRPGSSVKTLGDIELAWNKLMPDQPFNYTFLDDTFERTYKADLRVSKIAMVFSFITIIISALGLFGLAAFTAEQRTKEIGIRKVLGASASGLTALLSGEFVKLVLAAIVISSPLAYWFMHQWLEDFAYHINMGLSVFLISAAITLLIALITISFHSFKAAMQNPVKSLRTE